MAIDKPVPVPKKEITSVDLAGWASGLNLNGAAQAPATSFIESKDVELTSDGFLEPRRVLTPFLPDTVEDTYQKLPVFYNNEMYYFTADDNKIRFCQEGDSDWTDAGGANVITTNNGGKPKLMRVLDKVLLLNGTNGDKLCYADLASPTFDLTKFLPVVDPSTAFTGALTNLTAGAFNVYYSYSFTSTTGETLLAPILTKSINIVRDQWANNVASPGSIKVTRPASIPTNATYWNVYIALAATGGTIQPEDMLRLASGLDLNTVDFVDDGSLDINLSGPAPLVNNTDGPLVDHGIIEDGNPILWSDHDQNIYIGGGGPNALDFSINGGGYRAEPEKGTNYFPVSIVGFRTGQGVPAMTIFYSNTEGLSKQATLEQQTVNYGDQSFVVWAVTEQHYGAAGVAAPDSAINYNGKLQFLSTDGFLSANTQPLKQNVISIDSISGQTVDELIRSIKNSAMDTVVGAGWGNKFHWVAPTNGFDSPQQILISDDNNTVEDKGAWYTLDIPAQWIGVASPKNDAAFTYISQGQQTYKLISGDSTFDVKDGVAVPFGTRATGPLVGMGGGGTAHNVWRALVQTMFYITDLVGDITVGVTYRNEDGVLKTKTKTYHGPAFTPSAAGGYGDPQWNYANFPMLPGYGSVPYLGAGAAVVTAVDVRIPVPVDDITNEAQWFFMTPVGYSNYKVRAISFEGINLGVRPDLQ